MSRRLDRLSNSAREEWRHPLDRDADRVLYSSAWRRLRGITQVAPMTGGVNGVHDRQIHSLKVAQVGMRAAEFLKHKFGQKERKRIDPRAVYVAGLVHDMGHSPFGHVGEKELQTRLSDPSYPWALEDSFEGNAQTFRCLVRNSRRKKSYMGMDLTFEALAASVKYPWGHSDASDIMPSSLKERYMKDGKLSKWGYYENDKEIWEIVRERLGMEPGQVSVNAVLMDIADDITYAVHDIHDYFRSGAVPLHVIGAGLSMEESAGSSEQFQQFDAYAQTALILKHRPTPQNISDMRSWLNEEIKYPVSPYEDSEDDRIMLHQFESSAVEAASNAISLRDGAPQLPSHVALALEYLKELTWFYVINHPALSASQQGQRRIISSLHLWLCEWGYECLKGDKSKSSRNQRRLPKRFVDLIKRQRRRLQRNDKDGWEYGEIIDDTQNDDETRPMISRAAVDYISELSDAEAASLFRHLGGTHPQVEPAGWLY